MNIYKEKEGTNFIISLEGRLDTTTSPELEKVIKEETAGVSFLKLDLSKLQYISSAGLRVLLSAQKLMNKQGELLITGCSEDIMEIFDMTGFSDILSIG